MYEHLFLLSFPVASFFALRFYLVNQAGTLDPYIYTGYIHNFADLMARYGLTYYGVRFGLILPQRLFVWIFGAIWGLSVLRYLLFLTAAVPMYMVVKRHAGTNAAVLTYCVLACSPFFPRALLWDHPDAAGVPYLLAGISLVLLQLRPGWFWDLVCGCLLGLALNSNIFTVAHIGLFFAAWLIASLLHRCFTRAYILRLTFIAIGGMLVCGAGAIYYRFEAGVWNYFTPTIDMVVWLSKGGMRNWRVGGAGWMAGQVYVLVPVVLLAYSLLAIRFRTRSAWECTVVLFGTFVVVFYYVYQFALNANILQLFYYFSYTIPSVFYLMALVYGRLWEPSDPEADQAGRGSLLCAVALFAAPWVLMARGANVLLLGNLPRYIALSAVVGVFLIVHRLIRRPGTMKTIAQTAAVVLVGVVFNMAFTQYPYSGLVRPYSTSENRETDVYGVALQFIKAVPTVRERPGVIRFWYTNRAGSIINSVQSTYLWGYSRAAEPIAEDPGMPTIGPFQMRLFGDPSLRYLALIAETQAEIGAGLSALTDHRIGFRVLEHRVLRSGGCSLHLQFVELLPGKS